MFNVITKVLLTTFGVSTTRTFPILLIFPWQHVFGDEQHADAARKKLLIIIYARNKF